MATQRNVRRQRVTYNRRPGRAPKQGRHLPKPGALKPLAWGIGGIIFVVLVWNIFTVKQIDVSGNQAVSAESVRSALDASFGRHPFSRNLISLGLAPLETDLLQDQRLRTVTIERQWPTTLHVTVAERSLSVLWQSGSQTYLVDAEGVAVQQASGTEHLPTVTDSTGLPVTVGNKVAPATFIRFVTDVSVMLTPKTKLVAASISIPDTTSELYLKTTAGYIIKFDTTSGVEEQLNALSTVLNTLAKTKKVPTQYIDLRIPNKAYYL
jgi:cell division septal protein FtsQ